MRWLTLSLAVILAASCLSTQAAIIVDPNNVGATNIDPADPTTWTSGTDGTIGCWDYQDTVTLQTRECPEQHVIPADELQPPMRNPVEYVVHCLTTDAPIEGPLSTELSRIGQQIVDTAMLSARENRTVPLLG